MKLHDDLAGVAAHHANDMVVDGQGRAYVGNFGFNLDAALEERGVAVVDEADQASGIAFYALKHMGTDELPVYNLYKWVPGD